MEQKIIAVVAGREIKESDFEKFLQNVPREQQAYLSNPQFRQQCLDQFVALHMFAELGSRFQSRKPITIGKTVTMLVMITFDLFSFIMLNPLSSLTARASALPPQKYSARNK